MRNSEAKLLLRLTLHVSLVVIAMGKKYSCVDDVCTEKENGEYSGDPGCFGECAPPLLASPCKTDWNCSLAGTCNTKTGKCACDDWAAGADCSLLNLQPVDKARLGYRSPTFSSWGGSIIRDEKSGHFHMFPVEINCHDYKTSAPSDPKFCELSKWSSHSQVAHATSSHAAGPYVRDKTALGTQHHNARTVRAPDGSFRMYSISCCGNGKTSVARSPSLDGNWSIVDESMAPWTNPAPLLEADGNLTLFYRNNQKGVYPSCCTESISAARCESLEGPCTEFEHPVFQHTGEDPSVFIDHRGNYHMVLNAYPGGCNPKSYQGGRAWSRDGITWSEPRSGVFTVHVPFTDGTSMTCARRERPEVILAKDGTPAWLVTGIHGCPTNLTQDSATGTFTLVQALGKK